MSGRMYALKTVVEKRSNSRYSGTTSDDRETGTPGSCRPIHSPAARSWPGFTYEDRKQTATASTSAARSRSQSAATSRSSSGCSTAPSCRMRSATSNRSGRGTGGFGRTNRGSKRAGRLRLVRPISIRSRKPAVVTSPTRAPRRWRMAFVATVVPWTMRRTRPAGASPSSPSSTARASSLGVDGTFASRIAPVSSSIATRSVKVPPTSIPATTMRVPCTFRPAPCQRSAE